MSVRIPIEQRGERAFPPPLAGRIEIVSHASDVLRDNPLRDPHVRDLAVYAPPSGSTEGLPLLVMLSGFTGSGWAHFPRRSGFLRETVAQQIERLVRRGKSLEAVIVAPDAITSLGGSQYLNSTATGRYEDYVVEEIVPWAKDRFKTGRTGLFGHSSGGYGSLVLAMRHPDLVEAVLASSPDAGFEYCYLPEVPKAVRAIRRAGGPERFLGDVFTQPPASFGPANPSASALNMLAMSSCYAPTEGESGCFDMLFDWETGEVDEAVWRRWMKWDPIRMLDEERYRKALGAQRRILLGAGRSDEWGLDVQAHRFASKAKALGVENCGEHSYEGGHFDTFPLLLEDGLPELIAALSPARDSR